MSPVRCLLVLAMAAAGFSSAALPAADPGIRTVFVSGGEIYIRSGQSRPVQLTHDGVPKSLPVWSKDGTKIAFVARQDRAVALAELEIIDVQGGVQARIAVHPSGDDSTSAGMRFVESVEWLNTDRIAISGSINPSTSEYVVYDLGSKAVVAQFFDDRSSAEFSPDGLHAAYQTGSPHFALAVDRAPVLLVDGKPVYAAPGHAAFASTPTWSADSRALAIVARDEQTGAHFAVVWHGAGNAAAIQLPASGDLASMAFWRGNDLIVTTQIAGQPYSRKAWRLSGGNRLAGEINPAGAADPREAAQTLRDSLRRGMPAGAQADFWCAACELAALPREAFAGN